MTELSLFEFEELASDGTLRLSRGHDPKAARTILTATPDSDSSERIVLRLENAFELRDELDPAWATPPRELTFHEGRPTLVMQDPGGESLSAVLAARLSLAEGLRLGVGIASSLAALHGRGIAHNDIRPANILIDRRLGQAFLTGFGLATRLARQRQPFAPVAVLSGALTHMAPERTGRMNRSIDSRSDLYSLGVTLYSMLTGALPLTAHTPLEWIHAHIARRAPTPRR